MFSFIKKKILKCYIKRNKIFKFNFKILQFNFIKNFILKINQKYFKNHKKKK
jgi:hypothetical protein